MTKEREEYLKKQIKKDWGYFGEISKEEQTYKIIGFALNVNMRIFGLIKDDSKKPYPMCLAIAHHGYLWLFRGVPFKMTTDELIDAMIDNKPVIFWHVKEESEEVYENCLDTINVVQSLLQHIPEKFKDRVKNDLKYRFKKDIK